FQSPSARRVNRRWQLGRAVVGGPISGGGKGGGTCRFRRPRAITTTATANTITTATTAHGIRSAPPGANPAPFGVVSHASPTSSPSTSAWLGLLVEGQLSVASGTPSPSLSAALTC